MQIFRARLVWVIWWHWCMFGVDVRWWCSHCECGHVVDNDTFSWIGVSLTWEQINKTDRMALSIRLFVSMLVRTGWGWCYWCLNLMMVWRWTLIYIDMIRMIGIEWPTQWRWLDVSVYCGRWLREVTDGWYTAMRRRCRDMTLDADMWMWWFLKYGCLLTQRYWCSGTLGGVLIVRRQIWLIWLPWRLNVWPLLLCACWVLLSTTYFVYYSPIAYWNWRECDYDIW